MTAITLTAPRRLRPVRPSSAVNRSTAVSAREALPRHVRPFVGQTAVRRPPAAGSADRPVCRPRPARGLRLTRRGRLAITASLTAAGICGTMFTGAVSLAGTQAQHASVRYVTVAPGDTLWSIAGEAAPSEDRRDTVLRIVDLNALHDSSLAVGQRVAVPVGG